MPQVHLTKPDDLRLDIQRATWLAARMLRDAADAQTPEQRRHAFPAASLLNGLVRKFETF